LTRVVGERPVGSIAPLAAPSAAIAGADLLP